MPVMKRRDFITLLGGAAVAWPLAARAQSNPVRRIGVLMDLAADDPEGRARLAAFRAELSRLGWTDGGNIRIDIRWGAGVANRMREYAEELVALMPDAILASGSPSVGALQQSITKLPVVFTSVVDPVGAGFVASLARPGGNTTGFMLLEYSIGTKWLELLKDAEPRVTRVAVLRDPTLASGSGQFGAIQAVASSFGVELSPIGMRNASEVEDAVNAFAPGAKGGLIVTASTLATQHRELIVALASRHRLPAVYSNRLFVTDGGLLSYSPDRIDQFRQSAAYVDRILKGEKPADLPVQAPTKYELVINLKTAKALGLDVPPTLLLPRRRGDRVESCAIGRDYDETSPPTIFCIWPRALPRCRSMPRIARAQAYPTRPVRWIVPGAAGDTIDILARLIGQWLSERLGQPFVIENRPGAGGNVATEAVVRSAPDGYTLLLTIPANAVNATLYEKLSFNFIRDIAPVASIGACPIVLVLNPSFPAKTVPEFIAYAQANPGKINMASTGIGTTIHMSGELFKMMAGVNMVHVPYRGTAAALTDLISGQVQVDIRQRGHVDRAHQGRQAATARGDDCCPFGVATERSDRR